MSNRTPTSGSKLDEAAASKSDVASANPTTDAAVVTGITNLTIVENAVSGAKAIEVTSVLGTTSATAAQQVALPSSAQVNDLPHDINAAHIKSNRLKDRASLGEAGVIDCDRQLQGGCFSAKPPNATIRVRVTRFSHCEMCNDRDNSKMVQCDSCDLWYHFACVEVTGGIANQSWSCPMCSENEINLPRLEDAPRDDHSETSQRAPLSNPPNSKKTISQTSSKRSEQRKLDRQLQMLEEMKQIEQKYLKEKYRLLDAADDDNITVTSEEILGSEHLYKVQGWLRDTENCGEDCDSGLVEEGLHRELFSSKARANCSVYLMVVRTRYLPT
ncbi:uncharacterized protein LOC134285359 isoform X2 [Aedes albopictus]|uniref:PHD-type domain-containing protein n=1 Tax=Aedes albopictus TaxID=7160 RepID=A0ABM1XY03_AEDAL